MSSVQDCSTRAIRKKQYALTIYLQKAVRNVAAFSCAQLRVETAPFELRLPFDCQSKDLCGMQLTEPEIGHTDQ